MVSYSQVLESMPAWCVGVALGGKLFKNSPLPWATKARSLSKQLYGLVYRAMAEREEQGVDSSKGDLLNVFMSYRSPEGEAVDKQTIADEALTFLAAG